MYRQIKIKMQTIIVIAIIFALIFVFFVAELIIDAWREIDKCKKEIERLKRQGIKPMIDDGTEQCLA